MNINSLQGSTAYANVPNATPPVENTTTRDQTLDASKEILAGDTAQVTQKAYEVTITQKAQEKNNQEQLAAETQAQQTPDQMNLSQAEPTGAQEQQTPSAQGAGPAINIVA